MKLSALLVSAAIAAFPIAAVAETAASKALVTEALDAMFGDRAPEAVDRYYAPDVIQHNPDLPDGRAPLKAMVEMLGQNDAFKAEYARVIADDDLVVAHARFEGWGLTPMVAFDVFRVENGKIVEHWDNLIPEQPANPSGRTQIDGATAITDLDKTEANKAKVEEFITKALIEHEQVDFTQYINPANYLQHNPMVADGLDGFGAFMAEMAEQGISMDYTEVHQVIGEGNFVLTLSEGALGGAPTAFYDLFRLEDGLIVEHWDVISPMPGSDAPHNEAGKF